MSLLQSSIILQVCQESSSSIVWWLNDRLHFGHGWWRRYLELILLNSYLGSPHSLICLFDNKIWKPFCFLNHWDPSEGKQILSAFSHHRSTHLWEPHQGKGWGFSSKWNICGQLTLQKVGLSKLYQEGSVCWQFDKGTCCFCFSRREVRRYTTALNETSGYWVAIHSRLSRWWMRS